ncbi:MAG TPA: dihydroorotate dehydrogenase (quinone) [Candidatus Acidoferrum sp.]|nr:dihydroorotate dehydrogenase (quinone) [Candidatus Acidoferrum sp.]
MAGSVARRVLSTLDPELAHDVAVVGLRVVGPALRDHTVEDHGMLSQELFGRTFYNPVGLAAGFDKNADAVVAWEKLGLGFAEVGTVTPRPQYGNPKPRIARFPDQGALQNWLGFNNKGSDAAFANLSGYPYGIPIGVSVGRNKTTSNENAIDDYVSAAATVQSRCDYIAGNISSPNTAGPRDHQNEEFIETLLKRLRGVTPKPILIKLSPDLNTEQAVQLARVAVEAGAAGIIATNTTVDYSLLRGAKGQGGVSGRPLKQKSLEMTKALGGALPEGTVLISVGGIESARDAYERLRAGASLVQAYTGFVYHGFELAGEINSGLTKLLRRNGFRDIQEAIGYDVA